MKKEAASFNRFIFWVKSRYLIVKRCRQNFFSPIPYHRKQSDPPGKVSLLYQVITPLYTETDPGELGLQLGKVENLRVAAKYLDQILIKKGELFSFWRQMGRPTRSKGFVIGRELRQGCLIPTVAGGICQLSNSLYQAAKHSGMEIIERHGHTQPITGSAFKEGEDATVFWNYVDLRFRASADLRLVVKLSQSDLIVRLESVHEK